MLRVNIQRKYVAKKRIIEHEARKAQKVYLRSENIFSVNTKHLRRVHVKFGYLSGIR